MKTIKDTDMSGHKVRCGLATTSLFIGIFCLLLIIGDLGNPPSVNGVEMIAFIGGFGAIAGGLSLRYGHDCRGQAISGISIFVAAFLFESLRLFFPTQLTNDWLQKSPTKISKASTAPIKINTELCAYIETNNQEAIAKLMASGVNPNDVCDNGVTALGRSAHFRNIQIAKLLVANGANINGANIGDLVGGNTALHEAADVGAADVAEFLIRNGANVNAKGHKGFSPLFLAAYPKNNLKLLNLLISNGADVNQAVDSGFTPLMKAVISSQKEHVEFLLSAGANIAAQTSDGDTALHLLAEQAPFYIKGEIDGLAVLLISQGASAFVKNNKGLTPYDVAKAKLPERSDMLFLLMPVPIDENASFNCSNTSALTPSERQICQFPPLRFYDHQLSELYTNALKVSDHPKDIKQQQKKWMQIRDATCNQTTCAVGSMIRIYKRQIEGLTEVINNPAMYIEM